jgi:hypothetical protein
VGGRDFGSRKDRATLIFGAACNLRCPTDIDRGLLRDDGSKQNYRYASD